MFLYRQKYRPYGVLNRQQSGESGPSSLLTDLVSYWKMDEASGTRIDSHGSNNLTDNASVGSGTGKLNNAAQFSGSNYLSLTSADDVRIINDFSASCWVRFGALAGGNRYMIMSKDSATNRGYLLYVDTDGFLKWLVRLSGTNAVVTSISPVINTWYHVVARYDDATTTAYLNIDNGTEYSNTGVGTPTASTAEYRIGARAFTGFEDYISNGSRIDEAGIWERMLIPAEISQLYGSGTPPAYPF